MWDEFKRGNEICEAMETDTAKGNYNWDTLFQLCAFFEAYKNYLQIDISIGTQELKAMILMITTGNGKAGLSLISIN